MGPQLQRFSTDVSRSLNRTRFTLAIKQLAKSASERACCWTGNDTTNLLASVRELNEVVTKTPRDELQTLMPTVFSPLSKAINHEEVEVRKVVVLVRHPAFPIPPCDLSASVAHTGSAIDGVCWSAQGMVQMFLILGPAMKPELEKLTDVRTASCTPALFGSECCGGGRCNASSSTSTSTASTTSARQRCGITSI